MSRRDVYEACTVTLPIGDNKAFTEHKLTPKMIDAIIDCAVLADIAISLAQIADKIGCDYEVHTEFVADTDNQARMVTVYHRREKK